MDSGFLKQNAAAAIAMLKHLGQTAAGAAIQTACAVGLLILGVLCAYRQQMQWLAKSHVCIG